MRAIAPAWPRRAMRALAGALVASLAPLASASSWPDGSLVVQVRQPEGGGVAAAAVELELEGGGGHRVRSTTEQGWASFPAIPPGIYRVQVDRPGFQWFEMDDVRVAPGDRIVLRIVVRPTEADEVVLVSGGPSLPAGSPGAGDLVSSRSAEAIPGGSGRRDEVRLDGRHMPGSPPPPAPAVAYRTRPSVSGPADVGTMSEVVTRTDLGGPAGRAEISWTRGRGADPPGSRGAAEGSLDRLELLAAVAGRWSSGRAVGVVDGSHEGAMSSISFEGVAAPRHARSNRHRTELLRLFTAGEQDIGAAARTAWRGFHLRRRKRDEAPTLHVVPGVSPPRVDRDLDLSFADLRATVFHGGAMWSARFVADRQRRVVRPGRVAVGSVDLTDQGVASDGFGNGVLTTPGGLDRRTEEDGSWTLAGGLVVTASQTVDLRFELDHTEADAVEESSGVVRERVFDGGRLERFELDGGRHRVRQRWSRAEVAAVARPASTVTVLAGLAVTPGRIEGDGSADELEFEWDRTPATRIGVVWDFEGNGRSRAWLDWRRRAERPSQALVRRLTGSWDGRLLELSPSGEVVSERRLATEVPRGPDPPSHSRLSAGVEYEVLNYVSGGFAATRDERSDLLAPVLAPDGRSLVIGSGSATVRQDLWQRRDEVQVWLRKRRSAGWQLELVLGWYRSDGNFWPSADPLGDPHAGFLDDVASVGRVVRGPLPDDRTWRADLTGAWTFGDDLTLGWWLGYRSGAPISRLGAEGDGLGLDRRFIGDRGDAGRTPGLWWLNLAASRRFDLRHGELEVRLEGRNLQFDQAPVRIDERWTLDPVATPPVPGVPGWGRGLASSKPAEVELRLAWRW